MSSRAASFGGLAPAAAAAAGGGGMAAPRDDAAAAAAPRARRPFEHLESAGHWRRRYYVVGFGEAIVRVDDDGRAHEVGGWVYVCARARAARALR
jgi:hypothetical protein